MFIKAPVKGMYNILVRLFKNIFTTANRTSTSMTTKNGGKIVNMYCMLSV